MALQLFKIASTTVETPQASIDFSSIPSGYTDLKLVISARCTSTAADGANEIKVTFNGSGTSYSERTLRGSGSAAISGNFTGAGIQNILSDAINATANTFSNIEFYIPNYNSSNYKSMSIDAVTENNGTTAYATLVAGLWSNTSAITSIKIEDRYAYNFLAGSTATLYGVL